MRRHAVGSLLLALTLTACGSAATGEVSASGTDLGTDAGETVSLDFAASTVDGAAFEGSSLSGTPTVLWFWAPWCPTCRAQIPGVSELAEKHGDAVHVVGVGSLDGGDEIEGFAAQVGASVVQLSDPDGAVWRHFEVTTQSSYLVVDATGHQVAKGYLDDGDLADLVDGLVG